MSKTIKPARPRQITQTVRAGLECDDATGCVVPPIHLTSTFAFRGFGQKRDYDYTRSGNPTRDLLGAAIAELELGVGAVVTATGMAAIASRPASVMMIDTTKASRGRSMKMAEIIEDSWNALGNPPHSNGEVSR